MGCGADCSAGGGADGTGANDAGTGMRSVRTNGLACGGGVVPCAAKVPGAALCGVADGGASGGRGLASA
jgi:hypothetical protein